MFVISVPSAGLLKCKSVVVESSTREIGFFKEVPNSIVLWLRQKPRRPERISNLSEVRIANAILAPSETQHSPILPRSNIEP